jgi:replicative DNA helicase
MDSKKNNSYIVSLEKQFLASVLKQPEKQNQMLSALSDYKFSNPSSQEAYDIMARLSKAGMPLEGPEIVCEPRKHLSAPQIAELITNGFITAKIDYFTSRLKNEHKKQKAYLKLVDLSEKIGSQNCEMSKARECADSLRKELEDTESTSDVFSNKDLLSMTIDHIEKEITGEISQGKKTGYKNFDEKTGGLCGGDLWIVAARPSMGKTAFAINLLNKMILQKHNCVFFSLEMTNEAVMKRLISLNANVAGQKFLNSSFNDFDLDRITSFARNYNEYDNFFMCDKMLTIEQISQRVDVLAEKIGKIDVVCVDYLQHIKVQDEKFKNRERSIADISMELKNIAKKHDATVIAVSQLSRKVEDRKPPKPLMSDLRDSGSIEQDADIICLLYREEYYNKDSLLQNVCEVDISKNRKGVTGKIDFEFLGHFMSFKEI